MAIHKKLVCKLNSEWSYKLLTCSQATRLILQILYGRACFLLIWQNVSVALGIVCTFTHSLCLS